MEQVTVQLHRSIEAVPASVPVLRGDVAAFAGAAGIDENCLVIEISDEGGGMMPRLDSPGLGVGLPFIADTADSLDITSAPGGGAQLRMTFELHPAPQACA